MSSYYIVSCRGIYHY